MNILTKIVITIILSALGATVVALNVYGWVNHYPPVGVMAVAISATVASVAYVTLAVYITISIWKDL